jgi:hypothetical protein
LEEAVDLSYDRLLMNEYVDPPSILISRFWPAYCVNPEVTRTYRVLLAMVLLLPNAVIYRQLLLHACCADSINKRYKLIQELRLAQGRVE